MIAKGYIFSLLYAVLCVLSGTLAHKLGMPRRYSRKLVHIAVGAEWLILYHYMGVSVHFLAVCLICTVGLLLDYIFHVMPAMASDEENAPGTVYYGVAMSILAIASLIEPELMIPFGMAVFCTSLGDGAAGIFGRINRFNPKLLGKKTVFGFVSNLLISFGVVFAMSRIFSFRLSVISCIIIALLSAVVELVSRFGLDNILVTLSVAAMAYILHAFPSFEEYALFFALIAAVVGVVYEHRALSKSGIVLAVALAIISNIALGNIGFALLLIYFAASIITDKAKKRSQPNRVFTPYTKRKSKRNVFQVASNGAPAGISALLLIITGNTAFAVCFVAALAEALADTAASGLGALAKKTYDPFRRQVCEKGLSGGMSVLGTLSSLGFAAVFVTIAALFGAVTPLEAVIACAAAFVGMVVDSFIGSVFQAKFVCTRCGKMLEKPTCCKKPARLVRGFGKIRNSTVNIISNVFSTVLTLVICLAIA
ncbi:MAG: DUF92 domain-containing protein [Clostridia bacterium]|nr:DUF92 domain-containing protein [Clostridia bacterium]